MEIKLKGLLNKVENGSFEDREIKGRMVDWKKATITLDTGEILKVSISNAETLAKVKDIKNEKGTITLFIKANKKFEPVVVLNGFDKEVK